MTQEEKKQRVAEAALSHLPFDGVLGVGSGSTVDCLIQALGSVRGRLRGVVAASLNSERRLCALGIEVLELNQVDRLPLYIDGADEANPHKHLLKGGGGAMVREKILAEAADRFLCILDDSKLVEALALRRPLPVEVLPLARGLAARRFTGWGLRPEWRRDFLSDNGHPILDLHGCAGRSLLELEERLNRLPGVVGHGLFVSCPADLLLVAGSRGVREVA